MSCFGGVSSEQKRSLLEDRTPLGAYLSAKELSELAKILQTAKFAAGKPLPESPFYIVVTGQVEVREGSEVLCTKSSGSFFTRRAGLVAQQRHSISPSAARVTMPVDGRHSIVQSHEDESSGMIEVATQIVGKTSGRVLWVAVAKLEHFLDNVASRESRDVINAISRTNIGTQLSQVPFIQNAMLSAAELRTLGEICFYGHYPSGKDVFKQGDIAEYFYIILKGQVNITIDVKKLRGGDGDGGSEAVQSVTRGVGDSFGVAALVYNAAERKYSATASERTLCLIIDKSNFQKFLNTKASLETALMRSTKRFLLQRYSSMNIPIFAALDDERLYKAADLSSFAHYDKGDVIYRQGDAPKAFYVVLHGEVKMSTEQVADVGGGGVEAEPSVQTGPGLQRQETVGSLGDSFAKESKRVGAALIDEQEAVRSLTVGQHFGEVGVLLPQTPCIATTVAQCATTLLVLEGEAFRELFGTDQNLLAEMQIKLLRHGTTLRSCLNHQKCRPLFVKHIEGEYSGENILFYDAVWEQLPKVRAAKKEGNEAAGRVLLSDLVKEYIIDGANQQVNIPRPPEPP